MKRQFLAFLLTVFGISVVLVSEACYAASPPTPQYKNTSYSNQSVTLENPYLTMNLYRRLKGWGWGEVFTAEGKMMAVLDHLGEVLIRDQDIPMRLEADSVQRIKTSEGESLVFDVRSVVVRDMLKGTSFDTWMHYPYTDPVLTGTVTLTLVSDAPLVKMHYDLTSTGNYYVQYLRGPWFKVGESSFGTKKDDALLPGVDWAIGEEWTSGSDFFKNPWALRVVPHPNKVSIPLMAISYGGDGIGLSWDPNAVGARWFNYRTQHVQPVFAAPNFIDRMNNQIMGLMLPDASVEGHENELVAQLPMEVRIGQKIVFDAEMWLSKGNSMSVVTDWVKRHGLPEPSAAKWDFIKTLDLITVAYNNNLWHEGHGFGVVQRSLDEASPYLPSCVLRYMEEHKNLPVIKDLRQKYASLADKRKAANPETPESRRERLVKQGDETLSLQRSDGSFAFDPDGRHYRKDDFKVATSFVEPMGLTGATALDITILPAMELLRIGKETGEHRFLDGARRALEYCMPMERPEGGDFWETPLHAANLLAAGHAAIANYQAYEQFGEAKYKQKAIYWIRCLLPFTHLWEPDDISMLYNTKPVFSSSDWYFANWVRDHVQWEVLSVFAQSIQNGIRWDEIDPEIDWLKFQFGITNAAIRWMNVQTDNNWRPHNIPATYERYLNGEFEFCFPDTFNSTTGNYGGMFISPAAIGENIYYLLDRMDEQMAAEKGKKR